MYMVTPTGFENRKHRFGHRICEVRISNFYGFRALYFYGFRALVSIVVIDVISTAIDGEYVMM